MSLDRKRKVCVTTEWLLWKLSAKDLELKSLSSKPATLLTNRLSVSNCKWFRRFPEVCLEPSRKSNK